MSEAVFKIAYGFSDAQKLKVAKLYWSAFGPKLWRVMQPETRALAYIASSLSPEHAFTAINEHGEILGVAGFRSSNGGLVGGTRSDLSRSYGVFGGWMRSRILALLEMDSDDQNFIVDGLCVDRTARGQGIGTALLLALRDEARQRGYHSMRLDVVEGNTRARALYERIGFQETGELDLGLRRFFFGYRKAAIMVWEIGA